MNELVVVLGELRDDQVVVVSLIENMLRPPVVRDEAVFGESLSNPLFLVSVEPSKQACAALGERTLKTSLLSAGSHEFLVKREMPPNNLSAKFNVVETTGRTASLPLVALT